MSCHFCLLHFEFWALSEKLCRPSIEHILATTSIKKIILKKMWSSVFPVLQACKNLSLKDFCSWQEAQNRWVCMQPISHCALCLWHLTLWVDWWDECQHARTTAATSPDFGPNTSSPFPEGIFYIWARKMGRMCDLCTFSTASVSDGAQVSMICIWPTILCLRHFTESQEISALCFSLNSFKGLGSHGVKNLSLNYWRSLFLS